VNIVLEPGVYHATALTTTAGISLTFKGNPNFVEHWLINVDTFINFGANLTMALEDVDPGSTITFNAGGYTAIGAGSTLLGTYYAGTYITTGANVTLTGINKLGVEPSTAETEIATCGGLFTASGAITLGASNLIGSDGCTQGTGFDSGETVEDVVDTDNADIIVSSVDLGSAEDFVILAKTGVSTTGTTSITGNVGVSPTALTAVTGFSVSLDSTTTFATSALVTGEIYAADLTPPTPAIMTTAISDMETAYTDAAGRAPGTTEFHEH
jgi:hypothetical protein